MVGISKSGSRFRKSMMKLIAFNTQHLGQPSAPNHFIDQSMQSALNYRRRSLTIAARIIAALIAASIVGLNPIQPAEAASGNHPILKFVASLLIRTTVCSPKSVSADEMKMQRFLNQSDKYQIVVQKAKLSGLSVVPGGMKQIKIPIVRYLFYFVPISLGSRPHTFVLQPMSDGKNSRLCALIVAKKLDDVLGAAVIDPKNFANSEQVVSPAYERTFMECAKEHFSPCGEPCARRLFICAPVSLGLGLAGQFVPAVSSYVVCVLGSEECGGCACEALTDTIIDYGFAHIPAALPSSEVKTDTKSGVPGESQ